MKKQFKSPIVFIDDDCIFCNFWGNYITNNDKSNSIYISIPSSDLFKEAMEKHSNLPNPEETIILYYKEEIFTKSNAVIKIALIMKSWYACLAIAYIIPRIIRDKAYDIIAKRRKSILKDECIINDLRKKEKFIT